MAAQMGRHGVVKAPNRLEILDIAAVSTGRPVLRISQAIDSAGRGGEEV